jgi:dihydrodipicolinate synthase/N-acetylneuraminate lyase
MSSSQTLRLHAATVTPLNAEGRAVDMGGIAALAASMDANAVDGIFVCGTTGEGFLLTVSERKAVAEAFRIGFSREVIVHCGAQSTADTVALARHARSIEADAVAVIPPPYYPLDDRSLVAHLVAAARAAGDLPVYLYAFPARSGYPLSLDVVSAVRSRVANVRGIKTSDASLDAVARYIDTGLPVFVGAEPLIPPAVRLGAAGAVSGLACAFPEVVDRHVRHPEPATERLVEKLGELLGVDAFCAAIKHALRLRGVAMTGGVRPPLRALTEAERRAVARAAAAADAETAAAGVGAAAGGARSRGC